MAEEMPEGYGFYIDYGSAQVTCTGVNCVASQAISGDSVLMVTFDSTTHIVNSINFIVDLIKEGDLSKQHAFFLSGTLFTLANVDLNSNQLEQLHYRVGLGNDRLYQGEVLTLSINNVKLRSIFVAGKFSISLLKE